MPLVYEPVPFVSEAEWLASSDPKRMLHFLCYHWRQGLLPRWLQPAKTSNRKLRLLACACARAHADLDPAWGERARGAIELAERHANGQASKAELKAAFVAHGEYRFMFAPSVLLPFPYDAAYHSASNLPVDTLLPLVRDVFGNPYRPVKPDSSWLTADVVAMARAIDSHRAFDRLPELALLLEEAGCADSDLLAHCRAAQHHVPGCWVVDLILGLR